MNIKTSLTHKKCSNCNTIKERTDFYPQKGSQVKVSHLCKSCTKVKAIAQKQETKLLAVEYLGGKCSICNYNKCTAALEFHHIDEKSSDWNILRQSKFNNKLKLELDKCVLLCANCHREQHNLFN